MLYIGMRLYIGMFQNLRRSKIVGPTVTELWEFAHECSNYTPLDCNVDRRRVRFSLRAL